MNILTNYVSLIKRKHTYILFISFNQSKKYFFIELNNLK